VTQIISVKVDILPISCLDCSFSDLSGDHPMCWLTGDMILECDPMLERDSACPMREEGDKIWT
jgi:hypothetical protein